MKKSKLTGTCITCQNSFHKKRKNHVYCSKYCREKDWVTKHPLEHKKHQQTYRLSKPILCRNCGNKISDSLRRGGLVHCSEKCTQETARKNDKLRRKIFYEEFAQFKLGSGCSICGYKKCAAALDFHHKDPKFKERRIDHMMWQTNLGKIELEKCILVCKNCHAEIHEDQKIIENGDVYNGK